MKRTLLSFLLLLALQINAQITITGTNMPVSGDTARYSSASVAMLTNPAITSYSSTGANFTWYFDSLKVTGQSMRNFVPASATPYFFFGTGYGEKIADSIPLGIITLKNLYNFYKKNSTSFYVDGLGITFSGFPVPNFYTDKDELYTLPLNYMDRDSTTFKFSTITNSLIPFSYKKQGYRITEADGWGTVRTPYGTEQCLRVVTTQYSIDTVKANIPVGTFTLPINIGFPNYVRSYQWLTLGERVPYLEISVNVIGNNFTPTQVRYRDQIRSFTGIQELEGQLALAVYPNPATNQLNFIIPSQGEFEISLIDVQGRVISKHKFDNRNTINQNTINIETLSQGIYSGRISNGTAVQNFKFVRE